MAGVGIDLDKETEAERQVRHRRELADHVDAIRDSGEEPTFSSMYEVTERHRLEWAHHPTPETVARRESDRAMFGIRGKRGDGPEEPTEGQPPKAAPKRRSRRPALLARRR